MRMQWAANDSMLETSILAAACLEQFPATVLDPQPGPATATGAPPETRQQHLGAASDRPLVGPNQHLQKQLHTLQACASWFLQRLVHYAATRVFPHRHQAAFQCISACTFCCGRRSESAWVPCMSSMLPEAHTAMQGHQAGGQAMIRLRWCPIVSNCRRSRCRWRRVKCSISCSCSGTAICGDASARHSSTCGRSRAQCAEPRSSPWVPDHRCAAHLG